VNFGHGPGGMGDEKHENISKTINSKRKNL